MVDFNPDGSIKVPQFIAQNKQEQEAKMRSAKCMRIKREIINFSSPKKCMLAIKLSDQATDNRFIETIFKEFCDNSQTPSHLNKINEKEFEVEIGTHLNRCSDCTRLIGEYRAFLEIIEDKGNCSFSPNKNFCYEDYFE